MKRSKFSILAYPGFFRLVSVCLFVCLSAFLGTILSAFLCSNGHCHGENGVKSPFRLVIFLDSNLSHSFSRLCTLFLFLETSHFLGVFPLGSTPMPRYKWQVGGETHWGFEMRTFWKSARWNFIFLRVNWNPIGWIFDMSQIVRDFLQREKETSRRNQEETKKKPRRNEEEINKKPLMWVLKKITEFKLKILKSYYTLQPFIDMTTAPLHKHKFARFRTRKGFLWQICVTL